MDQYEKAIREKVYASGLLTEGEWVYLVGTFGMARNKAPIEDNEPDAIRLHREKMALYVAALAIVHSPTIKSVCGWYPEIEALRVLVSNQQTAIADEK